MAHVALAQPSAGFKLDELKSKLKSFGKTLITMWIDSRMETAKYRVAAMTSQIRFYDNKNRVVNTSNTPLL